MAFYLNSSAFLYHSFSYACSQIGLLPSTLCLLVFGTRPLRPLRPRPSTSVSGIPAFNTNLTGTKRRMHKHAIKGFKVVLHYRKRLLWRPSTSSGTTAFDLCTTPGTEAAEEAKIMKKRLTKTSFLHFELKPTLPFLLVVYPAR